MRAAAVTDDLVPWLHSQINEDEQVARDGQPDPGDPVSGKWIAYDHQPGPMDRRQDRPVKLVDSTSAVTDHDWAVCEAGQHDRAGLITAHIARQDPKRTLAEVEAKRLMITEHTCDCPNPDCRDCGACSGDHHADPTPAPCRTLRLVALPYADREGYREEWRP